MEQVKSEVSKVAKEAARGTGQDVVSSGRSALARVGSHLRQEASGEGKAIVGKGKDLLAGKISKDDFKGALKGSGKKLLASAKEKALGEAKSTGKGLLQRTKDRALAGVSKLIKSKPLSSQIEAKLSKAASNQGVAGSLIRKLNLPSKFSQARDNIANKALRYFNPKG
jgi:hypothetical protein